MSQRRPQFRPPASPARRVAVFLAVASAVAACAAPGPRPGNVSPEAARAEQLEQQQAAQAELDRTRRAADIAHTLLAAATPFCPGNTKLARRPEIAAGTAPRDSAASAPPAAIPADTLCDFTLVVARDDAVDAWVDGENVNVTTSLLRFLGDDGELAAMLAHEIAHNAMRHVQRMRGGPMVFSREFEREADYVGLYLLARVGRPVGKAADLWRRVTNESPGTVRYAYAHPTGEERFVRLERVAAEIEGKVARGDAILPPMRGGVAQVEAAAATKRESAGDVAPVVFEPESEYTTRLMTSESVTYTFGPATARDGLTLAQARRKALEAYQDGQEALHIRLYDLAETKFREAVLYDGGDGRYHAALGAIFLKRGKRAEAQAALSAAVLTDLDNEEYRELLREARRPAPASEGGPGGQGQGSP
jgi:hypothetical protein